MSSQTSSLLIRFLQSIQGSGCARHSYGHSSFSPWISNRSKSTRLAVSSAASDRIAVAAMRQSAVEERLLPVFRKRSAAFSATSRFRDKIRPPSNLSARFTSFWLTDPRMYSCHATTLARVNRPPLFVADHLKKRQRGIRNSDHGVGIQMQLSHDARRLLPRCFSQPVRLVDHLLDSSRRVGRVASDFIQNGKRFLARCLSRTTSNRSRNPSFTRSATSRRCPAAFASASWYNSSGISSVVFTSHTVSQKFRFADNMQVTRIAWTHPRSAFRRGSNPQPLVRG